MMQQSMLAEAAWRDTETFRLRTGETWYAQNVLVTTEAALAAMVGVLAGHRQKFYDTETSGLNPHLGARISGHSLAVMYPEQRLLLTWYVPVRHQQPQFSAQLAPELVAEAVKPALATGQVYAHNMKFDAQLARADGIEITASWHDTAIFANLFNENEPSFKLKALAAKYLYAGARNEERSLEDWMRTDARKLRMRYKKRVTDADDLLGEPTYMERYGYSRTPIELCGLYACHDVAYTALLKNWYVPQLFPKFLACYQRDMEVSRILADIEWRGMPLNLDEVRRADKLLREDVRYWEQEVKKYAGEDFEINDNNLRALFYERLQMQPAKMTDSGTPSVDKEARSILAQQYSEHAPLIKAIDARAKSMKMHSTYAASYFRWVDPNGYIHPSYNQLEQKDEGGVPRTGRLSSQAPNFQNIAKKPIKLVVGETVAPRRFFTVSQGLVRLYVDLSQIELRVLAWLSQDPRLLDCYAHDLDVHQITADEVTGGDRDIAKQVNFGNNYGMTEIGLAKRLPYYSEDPERAREDARRYLEGFFETYRGIPVFRDALTAHMRANGNMFISPFGRPRRLPAISSDKRWEVERAQRQMMSSIVSGTAADMIKEIMIRCNRLLKQEDCGVCMTGTIHDELIFDMPVDALRLMVPKILTAFTHWPQFEARGVPIRASAEVSFTTWADKKEITLLPDGQLSFGE